MSKRRPRNPPPTDHSHDETVWIHTEPSIDGSTYVVTLSFGQDHATVLDPDLVVAWCTYVMATATRAQHDAAIVKQLTGAGVDLQMAAQVLALDLRPDRPELVSPVPWISLDVGVTAEGKPFLPVHVKGHSTGQWEIANAHSHATGVLGAIEAANLDAAYLRALTGTIGIAEPNARNMINALQEHMT